MGARKDLALRSIRTQFAEWRRSKKGGDCIPDVLWDEVHALEEQIGRTRLALYLGLNASELAFQMNLRGSSKSSAFCEPANQMPVSNEERSSSPGIAPQTVAITKVVSVPFASARSGAAVEIESPSGWVMRLQADVAPEFLRVFVEATAGIGGGV